MATDYYLILGVGRDAGPEQIKRAYRALSKRHHPDRAGPQGQERFLQVQRAYEALSDPQRRWEYDRELASPGSSDVAPLTVPWTVNPFASFQAYRPSFDEIYERFAQNFTHRGEPKSQRVEQLNLELLLTPQEAAAGQQVQLELPVSRICGRCAGTGRTGFFHCDACDGRGMHWDRTRLEVRLPAGVRDGSEMPLSLRHLGVQNMYLNLHIRVAPVA